ncbi:lysophospholipid acyltransferase family protein [Aromatoleum petrolei]|uniref:1-acyl-sn-glycerol-3-phosphate acyltransferase n=1 Tax=Aromatoleum petrolei TaxID=76116 RepID=A0ABX1MTT3_9RHOO|nr:lysophospholipid acyltransferase family protein [Aromatoleum petrolei]NMF89741.1 1-acyl-sn-glycerol-3-phosphate acyltransferase [Aromatoleum petrolei]QTQ37383.1 Putative phospholipid/glycerol acyltransferase [Aromatoleum petrolei]
MVVLRSLLFAIVLAIFTPPFALFGILAYPLSPRTRHRIVTAWAPLMMWFIPRILGIRYKVIGSENIPSVPSVILSKHQSAWETMALQVIFPPLCFVLKRELLRVPFFGWGLAAIPGIAIDRAAGKDALAQVVDQGRARLAEGYWVAVFPEGTRTAPGAKRRYKAGGAALAQQAGVPVVPVAHNAGEFWGREAFLKYPGEITVSIGPAIDPTGLDAAEVNRRSAAWIEGEMHRLFPHHYRSGRNSTGAVSGEVEEAE